MEVRDVVFVLLLVGKEKYRFIVGSETSVRLNDNYMEISVLQDCCRDCCIKFE